MFQRGRHTNTKHVFAFPKETKFVFVNNLELL